MQAVTAEAWRVEGRQAPLHVGDVAWMRYQHSGREHEWRVRLWQRDGRDVAWAWLRVPDSQLFWCVLPDVRAELVDEVLEWADARVVEVQSTDTSLAVDHGAARIRAGRRREGARRAPP